jgi:hypothetical protein
MTVIPVRARLAGRRRRPRQALVAVMVTLGSLAPAGAARGAAPPKCPRAAVTWDAAAPVLRVTGNVTCTLKQLAAAGTGAPLRLVDGTGKVWLLGADLLLGNALKLDPAWAYNAVRAVGNYGEIFERNLGEGSPVKLPRGLNDLWTRGGLMYAPPIR